MGNQEWKQESLGALKAGISAIFYLLGLFASGLGEPSNMVMIGVRVEERLQVFPVAFFFSLFLICKYSQERVFGAVLILYVSLILSEKSARCQCPRPEEFWFTNAQIRVLTKIQKRLLWCLFARAHSIEKKKKLKPKKKSVWIKSTFKAVNLSMRTSVSNFLLHIKSGLNQRTSSKFPG